MQTLEAGDGDAIDVRPGRYGPYVKQGDRTASIPDDLAPDELTAAKALELLDAPSGDKFLGTDPDSGLEVVARNGRFGPYVQLGEMPEGKKVKAADKPRTASLFKDMDLDSLSLDQALRLLSLPRVVGHDPADGAEITAQNGRYGPYIKKGTDSRSLADESQLFTLTLDEALQILAQPKQRGRQAAPPLRELGNDPASGQPVVVQGRAVRLLRDRRRDERLAAQGRRGRVDHHRPGRRAAPEPARRRPGQRRRPRPRSRRQEEGGRQEEGAGKKAPAKKARGEEAGGDQERPAKEASPLPARRDTLTGAPSAATTAFVGRR